MATATSFEEIPMSRPVAVVTGASRGIGKKLAVDLAGAGFDVVCVARTSAANPSKLPGTVEETADGVRSFGRRAMAVALDVRNEAAVMQLADRIFGDWGRCDLLINNAAVAPPRPALDDSTKRWRLAFDVNVNGPFYFMYYLCPRMAQAGGGRVINVSSSAAIFPEFGRASYTATKRALEGLSEALGHDLRGRVAVNCLRIDLPIWSEGFEFTLPADAKLDYEDPVIVTDAVLWLIEQPISHTGEIHTLTRLREKEIVRPLTRHRKR
jgi:NAD(P)-dependent dehydrogenase (short-subunit alcohol dehydrogenase family)